MSSEWPQDGRPSFPTSVAHAGADEHLYRGFKVFEELVGNMTPTALTALGILGRPLDAASLRLAARVSEVLSVADPRIPPLLATRLVASEGRALTGVACGLLACAGARIGPGVVTPVATLLLELRAQLPMPTDDPSLTTWLRARREKGLALPGLGIPFRTGDERVPVLNRAMEAEGHTGPFWNICLAIQRVSQDAVELPTNIALSYGAICLDMGFDPDGAALFCNILSLHCFAANAIEATRQRHEVDLDLPVEYVEYRGTPARRSPRALAASGD